MPASCIFLLHKMSLDKLYFLSLALKKKMAAFSSIQRHFFKDILNALRMLIPNALHTDTVNGRWFRSDILPMKRIKPAWACFTSKNSRFFRLFHCLQYLSSPPPCGLFFEVSDVLWSSKVMSILPVCSSGHQVIFASSKWIKHAFALKTERKTKTKLQKKREHLEGLLPPGEK